MDIRFLLLSILLINPMALMGGGGTDRYVDINARSGGARDGTSWRDAFLNLQDALAVTVAKDTIHVTKGVYHPDVGASQSDNDESASFSLPPDVCLLGGYDTGGTKCLPLIYQTIISGDLDQSHDLDNDGISDILNNPTNVSDHLVVLAESPGTTTIDGIIFTLADRGCIIGSRTNLVINNFDWIDDAPTFVEFFALTQNGVNPDSTPYFSPSIAGDLNLTPRSRLKDEGNNVLANAFTLGFLDLARKPRIRNVTIDLGAYETPNPSPIQIIETAVSRPNPTHTEMTIVFESDGPVDVWRSFDLKRFSLVSMGQLSPYTNSAPDPRVYYKLVESDPSP